MIKKIIMQHSLENIKTNQIKNNIMPGKCGSDVREDKIIEFSGSLTRAFNVFPNKKLLQKSNFHLNG